MTYNYEGTCIRSFGWSYSLGGIYVHGMWYFEQLKIGLDPSLIISNYVFVQRGANHG